MSGGASTNAKQTNITFTLMSKDKPQDKPQGDTAETTMNDNERAKRSRFEMENDTNDDTGTNLRVPAPSITPSGSEQSLFDRESISTIIGLDQPPNTTPRETNEFTNVDEGDLRPRLKET